MGLFTSQHHILLLQPVKIPSFFIHGIHWEWVAIFRGSIRTKTHVPALAGGYHRHEGSSTSSVKLLKDEPEVGKKSSSPTSSISTL